MVKWMDWRRWGRGWIGDGEGKQFQEDPTKIFEWWRFPKNGDKTRVNWKTRGSWRRPTCLTNILWNFSNLWLSQELIQRGKLVGNRYRFRRGHLAMQGYEYDSWSEKKTLQHQGYCASTPIDVKMSLMQQNVQKSQNNWGKWIQIVI